MGVLGVPGSVGCWNCQLDSLRTSLALQGVSLLARRGQAAPIGQVWPSDLARRAPWSRPTIRR